MPRPLKVLHVAAELAPLAGTGGLADVAGALPKALHARGHDVRVAIPCYREVPAAARGSFRCMVVGDLAGRRQHGALRETVLPGSDVPVYLVDHEHYFGRPKPYGDGANEYYDNPERFSFFCLAVLDGIRQLGWQPDVVHCHDWHAAPLAIYLRTRFAADPFWHDMPVLFTIHNMAFQGRYGAERFPMTGLPESLMNPEALEYHGDMNLMKGAIRFANKVTTVSPRYAKEIQTLEYGEGLEAVLQGRGRDLVGILNGVDYSVWSPAADPHLAERYTKDNLAGKAKCKAFVQARLGFPQADVPLFAMVSRLYWQKGIDLLASVLDEVETIDAQIAILGTGDPALEAQLRDAAARHPHRIHVTIGYDVSLSHQLQAGCDFFLMPSRYEPCGLSQLYSMAYGAIPIVRHTGGLADTVHDINPVNLKRGQATGISFVPTTHGAMHRALDRAIDLYADPARYHAVQRNGLDADFSWDRSCREYERVYREVARAA